MLGQGIKTSANTPMTKKSFTGSWTTDENNKAIEKGYIWNFDKTSDDLFNGYIR